MSILLHVLLGRLALELSNIPHPLKVLFDMRLLDHHVVLKDHKYIIIRKLVFDDIAMLPCQLDFSRKEQGFLHRSLRFARFGLTVGASSRRFVEPVMAIVAQRYSVLPYLQTNSVRKKVSQLQLQGHVQVEAQDKKEIHGSKVVLQQGFDTLS